MTAFKVVGGRASISGKDLSKTREHGNAPLAWFYFGIGKRPAVYGHDVNAALSDYRPPAVVADIAIDVAGRGRYEVRQRPQGLGKTGRPLKIAAAKVPTRMRTDGGGILRYSYCDPAFIMGTPMTEARPLEDWAAISTQNRWQGVIFAGEHDARIVPIVRPKDNRVAMNAQWSVQSKGSLITQKLKHHKDGAEMSHLDVEERIEHASRRGWRGLCGGQRCLCGNPRGHRRFQVDGWRV